MAKSFTFLDDADVYCEELVPRGTVHVMHVLLDDVAAYLEG